MIEHKKSLKKNWKSNALAAKKIQIFLTERLPNIENPCFLPNAKKLKGRDNQYRWRLGDYRVIGIVENGEFLIVNITRIAHRQGAYD
ncbi:type II toxin-antitoxin system RelE/ParE family toxin [Helicobacter cinaedi]|nr:type II toxin-antitoxin system RelE/ParE family toxin [Helicobacter cinaedi]